MSPKERDKIIEKLDNLDEYLDYLKQIKEKTKDKDHFLASFELFGSAERYVQLSIQSIMDMIHLVIIEGGLKRPDNNYRAVDELVENNIIKKELGKKLKSMIGLRNILVHEYGNIDREEIFKILQNNLQDVEEIRDALVDFIKEE